MSSSLTSNRISGVRPVWALAGGRITIEGQFGVSDQFPRVQIGGLEARVVHASARAVSAIVPAGVEGGRTAVRIEGAFGETAFIDVGVALVTGLHQVDNPVFDREGNLYVTYSGSRGEQTPVSIYRVRRDGSREPFVSGIINPTSMAFDRDGRLYVSSRFDGTVRRVGPDGSVETVATDLGLACGLAFGPDGTLYVGDRSGTIFTVDPSGRTSAFAALPPSVAAFHLAMGPDACLYVTAPTLAPRDAVYRVSLRGSIDVAYAGFGRPQGLAFDTQGALYVVEALAGTAGLYRLRGDGPVEHALAAPALVGVAFDPVGGLVVASNETAYRLDVNLRGLLHSMPVPPRA